MISRRNFLGKSLKAMALVIAAPIVLPHVKSTANPIPPQPTSTPNITGENLNKGDEIGFRRYNSKFDCADFKPHIEVKEYKAGQTVTFQDLRTDECSMCAKRGKCRQGGKCFQDGMEYWSRKLQARLYDEAILTKFLL